MLRPNARQENKLFVYLAVRKQMNNVLACPVCGSTEFDQCRTTLFDEIVVVSFSENGELLEEQIEESEWSGEENQGPYCCKQCGLEIEDDDGEPLTEPQEIVRFFQAVERQQQAAKDETDSE